MLRITLEIDTTHGNIIGTKEAVVQLFEQYGEVKVVSCEAVQPTQMSFAKMEER